jgi:hypothetical protein
VVIRKNMRRCKGVGLHYTRFLPVLDNTGVEFNGVTLIVSRNFLKFAVESSKSG